MYRPPGYRRSVVSPLHNVDTAFLRSKRNYVSDALPVDCWSLLTNGKRIIDLGFTSFIKLEFYWTNHRRKVDTEGRLCADPVRPVVATYKALRSWFVAAVWLGARLIIIRLNFFLEYASKYHVPVEEWYLVVAWKLTQPTQPVAQPLLNLLRMVHVYKSGDIPQFIALL